MANNFEELYDELKSDYRFNSAFTTKKDFEDYLANSPEADEDMKIQYGVENATSYLKKKEESDSLSNSQLGGNEVAPEMGVPQDNQVVSPEGAEAQGISMAGVYSDVMPEVPMYGKSFQSNIAPPVKAPAVNPKDKEMVDMYSQKLNQYKGEIDKGSFRALQDFQRLAIDPKYKELKDKGYFNNQIKEISDSFGKNIYTKSKGLFDKPDVQKSLKESGIAITSATGFTPESLKVKPKPASVLKPTSAPKSERDKVFSSYLEFENTPVKTPEEEQIANQKLDGELSKDAQNLITDGVWIQPSKNNPNPGGFLFTNEDGIVEIDPIKVSNQVDKFVRSSMAGIPEELKPTVTRRLTRLVEQEAENRLISEGQKKVFDAKLAKENKSVFDYTKIPQEFEAEVRNLANFGGSELRSYQNTSVENITKQLSDFTNQKQIELDNFAKEIKMRQERGEYMSDAELVADSEVYARMVSDATTEGVELKNKLVATAEQNFNLRKAELEKSKNLELQKLYAKYDATVKDGKVSFAALEKLTQMQKDAYTEFMDDREKQRRSGQSLANRLSEADFKVGALLEWSGDRIQSATARTFDNAIEALNATVGYENNPLTGVLKYMKYVEVNNKKSDLTFSGAEGFGESTEAALSSILDQAPNLALGISVGVLTSNPYIGGMISWAQDTADQVGQNYKDKFAETGSEIEARKSAAETLKVQSMMLPLYAIQFLPFTDKFLSTARGISAKAVMQDVIKLAGVEYTPELATELIQNYTAAKLNNDPKYKDATFTEYAKAEGPTLALEILPSVAVMSGAGVVKSRYESVQREKRLAAFKQFTGQRGLDQMIASAIDVIGPNSATAIPEYLLQTGQITMEEFQTVKQGVTDIASTYPGAKSVIKDDNKSKYYVDLMGQQKELEASLEQIPEGNVLREFIQNKIDGIKTTMKDLVSGKDVDFVVFENRGGFKYVTDKQKASQIIERNKEAIETGLIKVNTKDADINATVQEMTKDTASMKGSKEVKSYDTGDNLNAATVDNPYELNQLIASTPRDQAEVDNIVQQTKNAQKVLDTLLPGVRIFLHSNDSYMAKMAEIGGSDRSIGNQTSVRYADGTFGAEIQVNLDTAKDTTVAHEVTHAILLKVFGQDVELFADFKDRLSTLVSDSDSKVLNDFVNKYKQVQQGEEYLVQLTAMMSAQGTKLDPTLMQKIAALINQFVSKITFGTITPFKDTADVVEVSDFFNALSDSIKTGQVNKKLETKITEKKEATQGPAKEGRKEEVSSKAQIDTAEEITLRVKYATELKKELEKLKSAYVEERRIEKAEEMGMVTEQQFAESKAKVLEAQRKYKTEKETLRAMLPRERGSNFIIEKLSRAARTNSISQFEADLAIDLIRKNPAVFEDLAISISKMDEQNPDLAGYYRASDSFVKLFKRNTNELTAAHELLHHTEKFLPLDVRNGIITEWNKQIDSEVKKITTQLKKETNLNEREKLSQGLIYLQLAKEVQTDNDRITAAAKQQLMRNFLVDYFDTKGKFVSALGREYYKFFTPSEWWAVNASELFANANTKPELKTWLDKAKAFYESLMESIKKIFGTSATAAVQKGLDTILKGKTLDVSQEIMLANIDSSFDAKPQISTEEKAQVGQVENLPVYFGGSPDILNNLRPGSVIYVTQDKAEAQRYAEQSPAGEQPNVVNELAITGNIATEDEARAIMDELDLNPATEGYSRDELMLMELLDPNMGESALSASDIQKFNEALKAKGFDGMEFVDNGLKNKEVKNIYIANTDVLNTPTENAEIKDAQVTVVNENNEERESGDVLVSGYVNPEEIKNKSELASVFQPIEIAWEVDPNSGIAMQIPEERRSMYDVVSTSGGAVVVSNSDGTGIGKVVDGQILQGGIGYSFLEQNVAENIGFAASDDAKIPSFWEAIQEAARLRDEQNPNMAGKPVAVFVMVQAPGATFGNAYSASYFGNVLKAISKDRNYETTKAKNELVEFINDFRTNNTYGRKYNDAFAELISAIRNTDFTKPEAIDKITNILITEKKRGLPSGTSQAIIAENNKRFGFDARRAFFEKFFVGTGKANSSQPANELRNYLKEKGFGQEGFYGKYVDQNIMNNLQGNTPGKKLEDSGFTMTGFFVDPKISKEDFITNSKKGTYKHKQFNSKFYGTDPFVLNGKYYVNEMFPEARFVASDKKGGGDIPVQASAALSLYPRTRRGQVSDIIERARKIETPEDFEKANEEFGTEDGKVGFLNKSQLNPKEVSTVSGELSGKVSDQQLEQLKKLINNDVTVPENKKTVYKLFKVKKGFPGELFPLFVGANQSVTTGEWIQAKAGELTKTKEGKTMVKSTLGPLAYRPGWHSGDIPVATHIGSKVNKNDKAPSLRSDNQVWAEVEVGDDVDWQTIANERAEIGKNGQPIAKTAHITDQVPLGGSYKYKTNSNMTGSWVISGEMKVNKVLTQAEVDQLNKAENAKDLPRTKPFDFEAYGFDNDGSVKNPKQVISNQVARAYLDAKEKGTNPELVSAVDSALKGEIINKSQLNPGDISPNFQSDIMSGLTEAEALKNIVKEGYLLSDIKQQLGLAYVDEARYKEAHAALALESIEKLNNSKKDTAVEIENFINGNYMMPMKDQVAELLSQGFSHYEIFRTMYNMDMGTPQEYQEVFGTDYRETIKNAIESENFSDDYLAELTSDTRTIKKKKVAEDLYETWQRAGMDFVDAVSMVEAYADAFEEKGMAEAAVAMRRELEGVTTQEGLRDGLVTFSALLSNAGFMLQLGRNLFPKKMGEMIAKSLLRDGIQLTPKQRENLERLVSDLNTSKDNLDAKANTFLESFSDEDYADAKKAEKQVKDAARELMKFLDNFKPKFWNDRLTSGGSRALLGIQTVGLSVLANVENALFNQNVVVAASRKAFDAGLGGIKSDTFSLSNWWNAAALSKDKTLAEMGEMLKYGFESDPNYIEKFYDGLAQVNFFKDTHLSYKMLGSMFAKMNGKRLWEMTDEEYADAFNQAIYKTKDGSLQLADGKTYKLLTSLFWGWTLAPQATELTGRLMALGGDKAFANAYTTRALIDYFQNTATSGATGGFIEDYMADRDLTLDQNTLKKLLAVVDYGLEADNPFEKEGLQKVFLGDNFLSKGLGGFRGKIRKNIKANYKTIKTSNESEVGARVTLAALQTADVLTWSVAPFAKVPANVVYVATQKSFPPAALAIYYGSQRAYDKKQKEFDKRYPKAVKKFATESQKKAYEEAKMELTKLKRQATYDFAQIEVSFGVAAFALTAVLAGAVIASSEPGDEKDKLYPAANLKAGNYNRTLHMEYLKALLSGQPTDNFAIRRGGAIRPGDKINSFGNMGISGYALGSYSSAYRSYNEEMVASGSKLKSVTYGVAGLLIGELMTSGAKQLPMLQGFSRLYGAFTDEKEYKFSNWASGTLGASLSVFSPSLLSVISKGNAELIQSLAQLQPQYEPSMNKGVYSILPNTLGKIFANTVQKLNRNVSFLAKNQYYEAAIGPFGEELQYRTTTSEPGTAEAYLETMVNPFSSRTYKGAFTLTPKQIEQEKALYRRSMNIHTTMVNLALAYAELTGSEYVIDFEGKKMDLLSLIADQMKNEFTFSTGDTRKQQAMSEIRQTYSAKYSLPMSVYRAELKRRGELKFYAMQNVENAVNNGVIATTQSYIRQGNLFMAQQTIENFFNLYAKARSGANANYEKDFKNRERNILEEMRRQGVIKKEEYEKLVGIGGK